MGVGWSRPPSLPLRGLRGACAPLRKRPAIHPGQTAGDETHAAFGRRSIPAKQPVVKPTRRSASDPPPAKQPVVKPTRRSASDPSRLNRVAARRSSLRFGRNTPGIPPSRALSAGRLTGLGTHPGSTTGCYQRLHKTVRPGSRGGDSTGEFQFLPWDLGPHATPPTGCLTACYDQIRAPGGLHFFRPNPGNSSGCGSAFRRPAPRAGPGVAVSV